MRMRIEMKCIGIGIMIETTFQLDVNLNLKPPQEEDVYCYDLYKGIGFIVPPQVWEVSHAVCKIFQGFTIST